LRPCDVFLQQQGLLLGEHGFVPDPGRVEHTQDFKLVFYHYSRSEALSSIFAPGSGLLAQLPVVSDKPGPHFEGYFLIEGLLEPLPLWLTESPYFGNLGLEMIRTYVGNVLLRIELPEDFPNLYVADAAHNFECKHILRRGKPALNLNYDCNTGREVCTAEVNSYIPLTQYRGGHVAPNVKALRQGEGIVIPQEFISISTVQPLV
jgi:hypothetical protein